MTVQKGRLTVDSNEDLVVFLIGARINKWWLLPFCLPILSKMTKMLEELTNDPESGLLGYQSLGFGSSVQYWKSTQHLESYARAPNKTHRPTWLRFMKRIFPMTAAGVWHETFLVRGDNYESLYVNMPPTGMGRFKELVPADGSRQNFRDRTRKAPARAA